AHARFDALSRNYKYRISIKKNVFSIDSAYSLLKPLDLKKMNKACEILFRYSDFQCFSKSNTDVKTYNCKITKARWVYNENELIFEIKSDRFLRNMVRAIVGTMIEIGLSKIPEDEFHTIIESKDRRMAGVSVPAQGLYLTKIEYPESIFKSTYINSGVKENDKKVKN
ncbi:MAG: tRNA pseudouridine synthase A, partial [Bacteroidota bacterium]